jgi:hypothetical protein
MGATKTSVDRARAAGVSILAHPEGWALLQVAGGQVAMATFQSSPTPKDGRYKFGGTAFRIPKPFEVGAIGTLAERSAEFLFDNEMTGKRFAEVVLNNAGNQLAMNPVPQAFKPIVDVYANKDSFTGRPIETMGMDHLAPDYRFKQSTSMVARGISTAGNTVTGDHFLSPVQADHLIRSYFGWLGAFSVGTADIMVRAASSEPTRPALDYWKTATGNMVSELDSAQSRYVSRMYDQARELEQAYGTWHNMVKEGKHEEAAAYRADHQSELSRYRRVEAIKRQEARVAKYGRAGELNDATRFRRFLDNNIYRVKLFSDMQYVENMRVINNGTSFLVPVAEW